MTVDIEWGEKREDLLLVPTPGGFKELLLLVICACQDGFCQRICYIKSRLSFRIPGDIYSLELINFCSKNIFRKVHISISK